MKIILALFALFAITGLVGCNDGHQDQTVVTGKAESGCKDGNCPFPRKQQN